MTLGSIQTPDGKTLDSIDKNLVDWYSSYLISRKDQLQNGIRWMEGQTSGSFNASLATINLAKAACKRIGVTFSISSCKSVIHNAYMLERFFCVFGIKPDPQVIDKIFKELILFTAKAA